MSRLVEKTLRAMDERSTKRTAAEDSELQMYATEPPGAMGEQAGDVDVALRDLEETMREAYDAAERLHATFLNSGAQRLADETMSYLMGHLEGFIDNENQLGSVASLRRGAEVELSEEWGRRTESVKALLAKIKDGVKEDEADYLAIADEYANLDHSTQEAVHLILERPDASTYKERGTPVLRAAADFLEQIGELAERVGDEETYVSVSDIVTEIRDFIEEWGPRESAKDPWLTPDEVSRFCESCARRLREENVTKIRLSALLKAGILERVEEKGEGWPQKLKTGRFTSWCKSHGFEEGAGIGCAKEAMESDDASVRGMAAFYMNTVKPGGKDLGDIT